MAPDVEDSYTKKWVTLIVDDKSVGIMIENSAMHIKEIQRLLRLEGIQWRRSTDEDRQKFRQTIVDYETKRQIAAEKRAARKG